MWWGRWNWYFRRPLFSLDANQERANGKSPTSA
ncbi:MAG: hypothetical protein JWQ95_6053 [Sphaerisporangium sp.]|nr:hypothetical protein [Sphaerisporangium sp.]